MSNHRFLAAWAEREQRRFDHDRANPRVPGTESTPERILQGFVGTLAMAVKSVLLPLYVVWTATLIAKHTVQSLVLAFAIVMLFGVTAFTTGLLVRARRAHGMNWFTGLAPRVRSH